MSTLSRSQPGRWWRFTACAALAGMCACPAGESQTSGTDASTGTDSSTGTAASTAPTTTAASSTGVTPDPTTTSGASEDPSTSSPPGPTTTDAPTSTGADGTTSDTGETPTCPRSGRFTSERFTDADIAVIDDLVFSSDGTSLDLYVPDAGLDGCATRPVLLMLHGGAWAVGQKEWMAARARFHARRGLVVATVDYRKTTIDALCIGDGWNRAAYRAMQDVHAAAQQLLTVADEHAIDPAAIFLYGNSAGAMTTLSLALAGDLAVEDAFPELVAGEGPLAARSLNPGVDYTVRALYTQAGAALDETLLDPGVDHPALLLLHSEGDASVPFATGGTAVCPNAPITVYGSSSIRAAIDGPGECIALVAVEGATHDLDEVYGERCDDADDPCEPSRLDDTAARFFSAVMSDTCVSQRSYCTAGECELVEGSPPEWFTLFP